MYTMHICIPDMGSSDMDVYMCCGGEIGFFQNEPRKGRAIEIFVT